MFIIHQIASRTYGLAAVRAYSAYSDTEFLSYAIEAWTFGQLYTLSDSDVKSGSTLGKQFAVQSECQGSELRSLLSPHMCLILVLVTMAGGTFWVSCGDLSQSVHHSLLRVCRTPILLIPA